MAPTPVTAFGGLSRLEAANTATARPTYRNGAAGDVVTDGLPVAKSAAASFRLEHAAINGCFSFIARSTIAG